MDIFVHVYCLYELEPTNSEGRVNAVYCTRRNLQFSSRFVASTRLVKHNKGLTTDGIYEACVDADYGCGLRIRLRTVVQRAGMQVISRFWIWLWLLF